MSDTVIFTLPLGYRPALPEKFLAVSNNAICVIDVRETGDVVIKTGANSVSYTHLDVYKRQIRMKRLKRLGK